MYCMNIKNKAVYKVYTKCLLTCFLWIILKYLEQIKQLSKQYCTSVIWSLIF